MSDCCEEKVRIPGIINMEHEDTEGDPGTGGSDPSRDNNDNADTEVKNLKLNIPLAPLNVEVGDSSFLSRILSCSKFNTRSDSAETRQRKRTRECLMEKMGGAGGGRVRSASAGRDKRTEMACRYWAILVENLRRAVDDLYRTCEGDESCMYAREVIMVLENYTKDFKGLVSWLKIKVEYENTPPPQRPTSLTWDIRKTSPMGKVTPVSTPGKVTPTRQLLLCSPAKRQLNFEAELEAGHGVRARSRQVSETIKEVGLEADCSPYQSWQDLQKQGADNQADVSQVKGGDETEDNGSEHEKSDSEQEKDCAAANVSPISQCGGAEETKTNLQEEKADPMTQSTDSTISEADQTESTSKNSSDGDLSRIKKFSKTGKVVTKFSVVGTKSASGSKAANKTNAKPSMSDKITKANDKVPVSTNKSTATMSAKSSTSKRDKSEEQMKSHVRPTSSFASKVKNSEAKVQSSVPSSSSSNPKMTRAKTTISSTSKTTAGSGVAASRRTAAGLLITTTPRTKTPSAAPNSIKPAAARPGPSGGVSGAGPSAGSSSPKQQRISLVARQSIFASEKKNPARKQLSAPAGGKPRSGAGQGSSGKLQEAGDGNNNVAAAGRSCGAATNPLLGSNTSLSSGSSSRSWADTVRAGVAGLSHRSVEDLSLNLSNPRSRHGSVVDSEGWCTVRRSRARFSPLSAAASGKAGQGGSSLSKARNRFKMPSSAMSLPSLALPGASREAEDVADEVVRPQLERSSTSASIIRNKRDKAKHLDKVVEKAGGSSNESLESSDPAVKLKKKKDQINQTRKQEAMKKSSTSSCEENEKQKLVKVSSLPDPITVEVVVHETTGSSEAEVENEEITIRKKAIAEAEIEVHNLQKEIKETEQAELTDTDCDNDNTDTDTNDTRSDVGTVSDVSSKYETLLENLSWAEQMELEDQLRESAVYETRLPGRAIALHDKLSSPARTREPHTLKHCQEKQDKARERRMRFTEEKSSKLQSLHQKKQRQQELIDKLNEEMKEVIDQKLKKAEEKRSQHIEEIKKKAHKEEEKLREIAFINELQAQNNKWDINTTIQHAEENCGERLAEIAEERAKKVEQREEREAKAEERRKAIEAEKLAHKTAIIEKRREREERIKEKEAAAVEQRKASAALRTKERLERLSTVKSAEQDKKEELQGKIQQKQEDAAKRHAEYLAEVRSKAWESSMLKCSSDWNVPTITNFTVEKKCEVCNVFIKSEVHLASHLRGKQHQEEIAKRADRKDLSEADVKDLNLKIIVDAPEGETDPKSVESKERLKNAKKKAKKIKSKLATKAADYLKSLPPPNKHLDSPNRAKIGKSLREIEKLLTSQGKGAWPNSAVSSLERAFGEMSRAFEKNSAKDQDVFRALGGFDTIEKIYLMLSECGGGNTCVIPMKSLVSAGKVLVKAVTNHQTNTEFMLMSNKLTLIVDILLDRMARLIPDQPRLEEMQVMGPDPDPVSQSLMTLLSTNIQFLSSGDPKLSQNVAARLQDVVSFIVCSGTVDSVAGYFTLVRDPIDNSPEVAQFLLTALQLVTSLTSCPTSDPSHLLSALQGTELGGTVSMLYGMLLHQGFSDRDRDSVPAPLPQHTLLVAVEACTLLHRLATWRDTHVQTVLGCEGISLEFRHIASYLLYYCHHHNHTQLLNLVIVLVGYFTANHPDNQSIVQSGSQPSVLQQLANLPFQYFSQPELKAVLFPTLLSCCHNNAVNMAILSQEMSWKLIEDFMLSEDGKENILVKLVTTSSVKL